MGPMVSVVVATYRRGVELRRALESLMQQTYSNFEIVLVDDNGQQEWSESVKRIVDNFRQEYPHIRLCHIVNHPNQGSARTRNVGIEASEGTYICFLDDDDIYLPNRIYNQLVPMQQADADYSVTNLALYSENEKLIEIRNRDYIKDTSPKQLLKYHLMYHITGTDTMMFRRNYLMKIGCFSPIDVGDEFYLMQKAIEGGGKFLYVPTCDVKAYVHMGDSGLSSGRRKIIGEKQLFVHKQQYFDRMDKNVVRYIKARHYAVLAFAYLRNGSYMKFLTACVQSFCSSPLSCMKLVFRR